MKQLKKIIRAVFCLLLVMSIVTTSGIPSLQMQETVSAATVSISQTAADLVKGQSLQLSVSGTSKKISWSSTNKKIASVDEDGYVVAKKAGIATIKAKTGKKTLTCKVTVADVGLNYKDSTVYVGDVLQMELLNGKGTVKWSTSKKSVATVNKKGKVTIKKKGTATIKATAGGKTYTCKLTVKKAKITRGQWINALVKKLNLTVPKKYDEYSFVDIDNCKYKNAIQLAYNCGIIPQTDDGKFLPNAPATREFAAYSAVKGLGFDVSTAAALTCKDKSGISYQEEVSKALEMKMLSLSKKKFNPQKEISKSDKNKILKVVKTYVDAVTVTKNVEKVEYDDAVQLVENKVDYSIDSSSTEDSIKITIPAGSDIATPQKGEIVVLSGSSTSENVAIKVETVSTDDSGNVTITGSQPELEEVFDSIDIEKNLTVELSDFVSDTSALKSIQLNDDGSLDAELNLDNFILKASSVSKEITLGNKKEWSYKEGGVSGSVTITAPVLTAIIKADTDNGQSGLTIDQFSVSLSNQIVGTATVSGAIKNKKIPIGHLEADIGKGFKVWLIFDIVFNADGKATVQCTISNTISYNYINGDVTHPISVTPSYEGTEAVVDAKLYLETNLRVTWLGVWDEKKKDVKWDIEIAGVYFDLGAGAKASATVHDTSPKKCVDLTIYAYSEIHLETDKGLGYLIKKTGKITTAWTLLDNNDSNQYRTTWHWENKSGSKYTYVGAACSHSNDVYTVTLVLNGGTTSMSSLSLKIKANDSFGGVTAPSKNGYTFDGWYDAKTGGTCYRINSTKITKNVTLYAHWRESSNVDVTFNGNGGTELSLSSGSYKVGSKYGVLPTVIKKNCEFLGWYTKQTGGSRMTEKSTVSRKNTTLYARWKSMSTASGYRITKYTGKIKTTTTGKPEAYSVTYKNKKLIIYGGVGDYNNDTESISSRKGYSWREYAVASDAEISSYDSSFDEDEDEEDAWISIDRSDLKEELSEMETGTEIIFKLNSKGVITEIRFYPPNP